LQGVAIDKAGNVWITNFDGDSVTKVTAKDPGRPLIFSMDDYGFSRSLHPTYRLGRPGG